MFSVKNPFRGPITRRLFVPVGRVLDKALGLDSIHAVYQDAAGGPPDRPFADRVLDALNLSYNVSETDLARVPDQGPIVVVANHCFGGVEGVILASLLGTVRADFKIMANYMLSRIPEMRDLFIFVDPFGGKKATAANVKSLKQTLQWLRDGRMLAVFPSGEVAHFDLRRQSVVESDWSSTVAGLVRRTKSPVLPVFFEGRNTVLFHLLGLLHPRLRTARLPHEVLNKRDREVPIHIGTPIPASRLARFESDEDLTAYLRMRTYNLRNRRPRKSHRVLRLPLPRRKPPPEAPVAEPVAPAVLADEVAALPGEQRLLTSNELEIWTARATQAPALLRDIGRLREITFRAIGEGTGKAVDLDRYDDYYLHLFLWNRDTREVVAAYRLGGTDEIVPRYGLKGLYTNSLFRYRRKLLNRIAPALEMGRSFVRESYQKNYASLLMLWKGIAHYVTLNPRYRILFGPVSISDSYQSSSRDLLVAFLKMNNYQPDLARLVKARTPLRQSFIQKIRNKKLRTVVDSIGEVESLITDVETELSGIPILLKQYLKLGGKLIGFNIDPEFGYVLDGLILVDLHETDPKILSRYMGKEELSVCKARWDAEAAGKAGAASAAQVSHA